MAICNFAVQKIIPPGSNDPRIKARVGLFHVDAGNAESLYEYFKYRSGGIESHFHIKKSGVIEQYRDTDYQADANHRANDFAISVETQGFGEGEWTEEQLESIKRLMRWMNAVHGIPWQKVPVWDGAGFGYHTMFGSPSNYTPVAKSCPGPDRIKQFNSELVEFIRTKGAPPKPDPHTPNIDKALSADTREERKRALRKVIKFGNDEASAAAMAWLQAIRAIEEAQAITKDARADLKVIQRG